MRILDGEWGNEAGKTLAKAHKLHEKCDGDVIVHAEADEVWDPRLLDMAVNLIKKGKHDLAVWRLQVSQNFLVGSFNIGAFVTDEG